jgi:hypothetical protein
MTKLRFEGAGAACDSGNVLHLDGKANRGRDESAAKS